MLNWTRPLRVAVLCSGRAPGLLHLLHHDRRRGSAYDVVCCVTSEETFSEQVKVERRGIRCVPHPLADFCAARGATRTDRRVRAEYDMATAAILRGDAPDLVLLDGYLLLLTAPMLDEYAGRIINLHHSDLMLRNRDGSPRYPGLRAVRDAVLAGETETRASAHLVTAALDSGPVLLRSWAFPVPPIAAWARAHEAHDVLKPTIWAHQEWMLREAWGPMMAAALEVAEGGMRLPGSAIDPARAGRWALAPDGSFAPDGVLLEAL